MDRITQRDGRRVPVNWIPGERNGVEITCIRHALVRLDLETDLGPMERQGHTYSVRVRDLPILAEEFSRLAEMCAQAFEAHSTAEERAERVAAVAEGLSERLADVLAAQEMLAGSEVAPHEDTAATGHLSERGVA